VPYMIRKSGDKHKVYKKGMDGQPTGPALGVHPSRHHAAAQIKALYANESSKPKKKQAGSKWFDDDMDYGAPKVNPISDGDDYPGDWSFPKLDPDDQRVAYDPVGGDSTSACANCFWYDADDTQCRLVEGDIVATGLSNLWLRTLTDDEEDAQRAIPVQVVGQGKETRLTPLAALKTAIKQIFGADALPAESLIDIDELIEFKSGFKTFGSEGQFWAALFSNNARDRDGEWFSQKSHDEFIERIDAGIVPMPQLDYWHSKAYHGQAFWVERVGHMMLAVGTFYDDPFSKAMKEYYKNAPADSDLVSFGYFYPRSMLVDGVYHAYNAFEISPLPSEVAANLYTGFASLEEFKAMSMTAEKIKALEQRLGPTLAKQLIAQAETKSKELDKVETSFKGTNVENPLEVQVKALSSKFDLLLEGLAALPIASKAAKKDGGKGDGKDGADEEDQADGGDDEEAEGEPPAKKKSRKAIDANASFKEIAGGFKTISDAIGAINKTLGSIQTQQNALGNAVNVLYKEISEPTPATRSVYTQIPPDNPALAALQFKMEGGGDPQTIPTGADAQSGGIDLNKLGATIFGPQFFPSANGHGS